MRIIEKHQRETSSCNVSASRIPRYHLQNNCNCRVLSAGANSVKRSLVSIVDHSSKFVVTTEFNTEGIFTFFIEIQEDYRDKL
ncbi:unnamed protein product [Allacma fusca]|uniref:Uncharacterized protein n=1 Tax=Allacma fusca TaxID=39272 RepID=A0A8J2NQZ3_9HEXA|nr:unnamed protein product [Allacma fusca]